MFSFRDGETLGSFEVDDKRSPLQKGSRDHSHSPTTPELPCNRVGSDVITTFESRGSFLGVSEVPEGTVTRSPVV